MTLPWARRPEEPHAGGCGTTAIRLLTAESPSRQRTAAVRQHCLDRRIEQENNEALARLLPLSRRIL